jgi:signal transduction histidine kinase
MGMRWWLALAFGLIAFVTALVVWFLLSGRAERAFREHAEAVALANARSAADAVDRAVARGDLDEAVPVIANRRQLALFVFDDGGRLLTPSRTFRTNLEAVPDRGSALRAALAGRTVVIASEDAKATVVTLPLRRPESGALLAYAPRPEVAAGLGIAREKIAQAALLATVLGALAGFGVAAFIIARLRRIRAAAAEIEAGDFERPVQVGFRDELGELAASIERMRLRLRESFSALASERDRLHLLLERLREGVMTVDVDLRVGYANAAARAMLGIDDDADATALPEPWRDLSLHSFARRLFATGAEVAETRVSIDDERMYSVVGIPGGTDIAAVIVLADVSERERRERAQREFVTNAAHELRTPLSIISGSVEMLEAGAKDVPEERDRFLRNIGRESQRLGRLARALLILARAETRAETPRLEPVELRPLFERVAATLTVGDEVAVEVEAPRGLLAHAQPELAEQIVSNLAENSAKNTVRGRILLAARASGDNEVEITVTDTGTGIDVSESEQIFERFHRAGARDGDGFGLGLAIVQQAVRALGGRVELESVPGEGTNVRVFLGQARAASSSEPEVARRAGR